MENVSYVGLSHQMALQNEMATIANNIANMTTSGFKAQQMVFIESPVTPRRGDRISMTLDLGTVRDLAQGPITPTGNRLDVALEGEGYFLVQTPQGERYTRAGNFTLNERGEIVTSQGNIVLGSAREPLVVPPGAAQIHIDPKGAISTEFGEVGAFQIVAFEDENKLEELGNGLYDTKQATRPAADVKVMQGAVEGSNVNPVAEINRMTEVLRSYQNVQRLLQSDHELQRSMISRLSRIN